MRDFLTRYRRNPAAVVGLFLLLGVIGLALTADIFFPRNPLSLAGRPLQWPFTNPNLWLGTDQTAVTLQRRYFMAPGCRW